MSSHHATVSWQGGDQPFTPAGYNRDHHWQLSGGQTVNASAAPAYKGNPDCVDPEEAFTASLASCHMLTFLYIAASKGFTVSNYVDNAEGQLGKTDRGMAMVKVILRPDVTFTGNQPEPQELEEMHHLAHKGCFLANSVTTEVVVEAA